MTHVDIVPLLGDKLLTDELERRGYVVAKPGLPGEANARLIAAAPELYDALAVFAKSECPCAMHKAARAALAKARGEEIRE